MCRAYSPACIVQGVQCGPSVAKLHSVCVGCWLPGRASSRDRVCALPWLMLQSASGYDSDSTQVEPSVVVMGVALPTALSVGCAAQCMQAATAGHETTSLQQCSLLPSHRHGQPTQAHYGCFCCCCCSLSDMSLHTCAHSDRQYCRDLKPSLNTTISLRREMGPNPGDPSPPRMQVGTQRLVHPSICFLLVPCIKLLSGGPCCSPAADSSLGTLPSACRLLSTSSAAEQLQANCRTHAAAKTASLAIGGCCCCIHGSSAD